MSTKKWWNPPAVVCICDRCGRFYGVFDWKPPFECSRCHVGAAFVPRREAA
jgi:hypothetical protein